MSDPKTVAEVTAEPAPRSHVPGTRTLAELLNDPRFRAARQLAKERLHADILQGDLAEPYTPPAKDIRRYTDDELKEAMRHCGYCGGMGVVGFRVPVTDSLHGTTAHCPNCMTYKDELRNRRDIARMKGTMERYSMLKGSLLQKTFRNFERTCDSVEKALKQVYLWTSDIYTQSPDAKPWLYLHGPTGTGKTHLAAASANGLAIANIPTVFTTFPQLLGMVSADHFDQTEPVILALQTIPVLILDDVRDDNLKSAWACSVLFRILDQRYVTESPTMVVSNHALNNSDPTKTIVTLAQFEPRVASRLGDKGISRVVTVTADDRRTA